ncbi:MAG: Unknown protein [uncultured Sulfurovum sp.]|uniref:Uncharacterized protein n=1 Tax=uncultured Sulfurovum sp. TaxID=269237 RepID=A0A6S6UDC6_9BACT|nr:MAG: Unknown protein [uncultured Sulfurovum sp.]
MNRKKLKNVSMLGESNWKQELLLKIKAEEFIIKESKLSLVRIVESNLSESDKKDFNKLEKEMHNKPFKELVNETAKFQNLITLRDSTFNLQRESDRDEFLRDKYYDGISMAGLIENDLAYFDKYVNQVIFKRELREKLWNLLRYDLATWCGKSERLLIGDNDQKGVIAIIINFIIKHTQVKEEIYDIWFNSDESKEKVGFQKAFQMMLDELEKLFKKNNYEKRLNIATIEEYFKDYFDTQEPKKWQDKVLLKSTLGWRSLETDYDYQQAQNAYNDELDKIEDEKVTATNWINHIPSNDPLRKSIATAILEQARSKRVEENEKTLKSAEKAFYDKNKYSKKRADLVKQLKDKDAKVYQIDEITNDVQKYVGSWLGHALVKVIQGKDKKDIKPTQKEMEELTKKLLAMAAPLFSTFPMGSFVFAFVNGVILESIFTEEKGKEALITKEIRALKGYIGKKFDEQFGKIQTELRLLDFQKFSSANTTLISDRYQKVLDKIDKYSRLNPEDIKVMQKYFDSDFEVTVKTLLIKAYGIEVELKNATFESKTQNITDYDSLLGILFKRLKEDDTYTMSQFYGEATHINKMLINILELISLKQKEALNFFAVIHENELNNEKRQEYFNTILNIREQRGGSAEESRPIKKIIEYINNDILKLFLGNENEPIIKQIYGNNQTFIIVPVFNNFSKKGKNTLLGMKERETRLVQKTDIDSESTKYLFKLDEKNQQIIRYVGEGSATKKTLSLDDKNRGTSFKIKDEGRINRFDITLTKEDGVFYIQPMDNNSKDSSKAMDVYAYNKNDNAEIVIYDKNHQENQKFNLIPLDPVKSKIKSADDVANFLSFSSDRKEEVKMYAYFRPGSEIIPNLKYYSRDERCYIYLDSETQTFQVFYRDLGKARVKYELPVKCTQLVYEESGNLVAYIFEEKDNKLKKKEVWSSNTFGAKYATLEIRKGSFFAIQDYQERYLWGTLSPGEYIDEKRSFSIHIHTDTSNFLGYPLEAGLRDAYFARNKLISDAQSFIFVPLGNSGNIFQIVSLYDNGKYALTYTGNKEEAFRLEIKNKNNKNQKFFVVPKFLIWRGNIRDVNILPVSELENHKTLRSNRYTTHHSYGILRLGFDKSFLSNRRNPDGSYAIDTFILSRQDYHSIKN